jgi:competence ComEA-like helix-hairpin-helix protein
VTTPEQTAEAGLLDINTASATELESLPGIGPVLAGRIVAHREANGPFARTDGLLAVDGIGPALLSAVRPSVAVLSVGEGNPYGHPTAAALGRLGAWVAPEHLYRTDRDGSVELATDGTRWWARPFD